MANGAEPDVPDEYPIQAAENEGMPPKPDQAESLVGCTRVPRGAHRAARSAGNLDVDGRANRKDFASSVRLRQP